jgi:hypothetical protein
MKLFRLIKLCLNETYSKVHIDKYLPNRFPYQNGLQQGYAISSLLLNFALEYAIRRIRLAEIEWDTLTAVYADDVNLLGDNTGTIKKTPETLIDANNEVGLELNTEKTK